MNLFKNLIDISSENGKIHEFLNLQMIFHKTTGCDRTGYDIFNFLKSLEEALFDLEKCCDHQRIVFINQCMKYPNVFNSMLQLKSKKQNVKVVVEDLRRKNPEELFEQKKAVENQIEDLVNQINSSSN